MRVQNKQISHWPVFGHILPFQAPLASCKHQKKTSLKPTQSPGNSRALTKGLWTSRNWAFMNVRGQPFKPCKKSLPYPIGIAISWVKNLTNSEVTLPWLSVVGQLVVSSPVLTDLQSSQLVFKKGRVTLFRCFVGGSSAAIFQEICTLKKPRNPLAHCFPETQAKMLAA